MICSLGREVCSGFFDVCESLRSLGAVDCGIGR